MNKKEISPTKILLDYANKVSEAHKVLEGYTTAELSAYRAGLLKAIELLQDEEGVSKVLHGQSIDKK